MNVQDEPWDPTLWEEFCVSLGASSVDGLDLDQFIRFQAAMDSSTPQPAPQPTVEVQAEPEAELEKEPAEPEDEMEPAEAYAVWCASASGMFMSQEQIKNWALALTSSVPSAEEQWDDALWPKLCASYGASTQDGFTFEQFAALYTAHAEGEAARQRLDATKALAEAYKVGAVSKEQYEISIQRLREQCLAAK